MDLVRQNWNSYFMSIAEQVATRATCSRRQVGCVIVFNKNILATGYNGSLPGDDHCFDVGCLIKNNHCIRTIHAETNAINQAAKNGIALQGSILYCTSKPCWNCLKNTISAGIKTIYYKDDYHTDNKAYDKAEKTINVYKI
jgi:dCMP deaminase